MDRGKPPGMRGKRRRVGLNDPQTWPVRVDPTPMVTARTLPDGIFRLAAEAEGDLPPGHRQIDIRQDLGIQ